MKITYRWLQEFVPAAAAPKQLAEQLTLAGLEVESIDPAAPPFENVVVGEVLETSRHPNAEKLSVCGVTTDGSNRLQIICGASNVRAGLKVAVAMVGAQLPNDVHIKRAKLRGIDSEGMLCSARELGLGTEHEGIMELASTLKLGTDVRKALDLDDTLFEIKTLNRGDCMSVLGLARDYAAASVRKFLKHDVPAVRPTGQGEFPVTIHALEACPLFAGRVIRGIRAGARSPAWLQERLRRVGVNSISAVVDVTNYVMMELGQPMHAYDLGRLSQGIDVRWAKPGEQVTLLDGKTYSLDAGFLVIADASGPVGLAGVMGGNEKAISDATTDVFLEAAHFVPDAIIGRGRRFGLITDAAQRFERGVDPALPVAAIERATALLLEIVGGVASPAQAHRGSAPGAVEVWITLRRARLSRLLGVEVADADVLAVLNAISEQVIATGDGWRVRIPTCRFDLRIEEDLVEEVARLRGFDSIPPRHASVEQKGGTATESRIDSSRLITALADRGYREAITYSFVSPTDQRLLFPEIQGLALTNPISADLSEMRVSLWPGLLRVCAQNLRRQQSRVRLFEVGRKYLQSDDGLREVDTIAAVAAGSRRPEQWSMPREPMDFFDLKADVTGLLELTGDVGSFKFVPEKLGCLRPGRTARIYRGETAVGWIGEMHPSVLRGLDLTIAPYIFELEIDVAFASNKLKFNDFSKFPSIRRDIALVVEEKVTFADIQENVSVSASGLLRELRLFDVYRGPGIDSGRKSVALGLILQESSRTLTDDDADVVVAAVVARLRQKLSATIRDQ